MIGPGSDGQCKGWAAMPIDIERTVLRRNSSARRFDARDPHYASSAPPPTASRSSHACSPSPRSPGEDALAAALAAEARACWDSRRALITLPDRDGNARVAARAARCARCRSAARRRVSFAASGVDHARSGRPPPRSPARWRGLRAVGHAAPARAGLRSACSHSRRARGPRRDRPATLELALAFAGAASAAFAHQAGGDEHRRTARHHAALARAAKTLNESLDLATLLGRICHEAAALIGADSAVIYRVTDTDALAVEAAHGLPPEQIGFRMAAGAGLAGKVLLEDRPMMTDDYAQVGRRRRLALGEVLAPCSQALRGVLAAAGADPHHASRARAPSAPSPRRQPRSRSRAARTDPLPVNHAALHDGLAREIERAERIPGATLALVLIDLDRFKEVNDEHGHLVGDEVLRRVGHALRSTTRPYDLEARYGGDEFALVAIDADEEQAREIAARAIERIASRSTTSPRPASARRHRRRGRVEHRA